VPDLLENGVNGVGAVADDAESLCDGLLGLLRDAVKRRRLAECAQAGAAGWNATAMARAVGEVYRRACVRPA